MPPFNMPEQCQLAALFLLCPSSRKPTNQKGREGMDDSRKREAISVANATVSDHGVQFIGNTTIGSFHYSAVNDDRDQRQWQSILQWLSPPVEAIQLQNIIDEEARTNHKIEHTGQWFVCGDQFQDWLQGSSRLAWVNGPMGCGKTVLFFLATERGLQPLVSQETPNIKFLVTSRKNSEIETYLHDPVQWDSLSVDTRAVQEDIRTFVISEIQSHLRLYNLPQQTREAIILRVADQSQGMFRWAFLQIQALKKLKRPVTAEKVEHELASLPKSLNETYDRILNGLDQFDKPRARSALRWLVFSSRQLYVEELIDASLLDGEKPSILGHKLSPFDIQALLEDLISIQPTLPPGEDSFQHRNHVVTLVHASIKEYLVREKAYTPGLTQEMGYFSLLESESQKILAQTYLAYLLSYNTYELRHCCDKYPLRNYAWYHWEDHIDILETPCVPTVSTAMLRRKATKLLALISRYPGQEEFRFDPTASPWSSDIRDAALLWDVLDGLRYISGSRDFNLGALKTALNVPFFHPHYDMFCPAVVDSPDPNATSPGCGRALSSPNLPSVLYLESSYEHQQLPDLSTYIRLLEILPAVDPETEIHCRLFIVKLDEAPPYAALSYNWGRSTVKPTISLEGHKISVLPSQHKLLSTMRTRNEIDNPAIWVDYLCVYIKNIEELTAQTQIIGTIYSRAREVVVGLDIDDDEDTKGAYLLADLASSVPRSAERDQCIMSARLVQAINNIECSQSWHYIFRIFNKEWWGRAWVIQEVITSSKVVILYGSITFNFSLVEQVMLAANSIKEVLWSSRSPTLAAIQNSEGWYVTEQIARARLEHRSYQGPRLATLLWRFRRSATVREVDRIHALLSLCDPEEVRNITIDYYRHIEELASIVSNCILRSTKNLDMLSLVSTFRAIEGPQRTKWFNPFNSENRLPLQTDRQPMNTNLSFGTTTPRIYSAAGLNTESVLVPCESIVDLVICGMAFDQVAFTVGTIPTDSNVREQFTMLNKAITLQWKRAMSLAHPHHSDSQASQITIETLWRVLLADQWPVGTRLTTATYRNIRVPPKTEEEESALLEAVNISLHLPYLEGRQVIITNDFRLGLAPEEARVGDSIAIMPGGALPYILRSCHDNRWQLIGECYIHGCMDGQIAEKARLLNNDWWTDTFHLI
ncbi:heterokaryon incompatibility protein-domain-containing protein [Xylariaceae sp. FL1651]|nr:heterokaryon incompatibility protein-domain-containing protein [Xylariaceae sp. FL1651]